MVKGQSWNPPPDTSILANVFLSQPRQMDIHLSKFPTKDGEWWSTGPVKKKQNVYDKYK